MIYDLSSHLLLHGVVLGFCKFDTRKICGSLQENCVYLIARFCRDIVLVHVIVAGELQV